jgi:hypothetical protein
LLRLRLHQVHIPSLHNYFLLLPKLTEVQLDVLSSHLEGRGFRVRKVGGQMKLLALMRTQRISVYGRLGLASSGTDLLDAIAPAVPGLLRAARAGKRKTGQELADLYFSVKGFGISRELQFFPRLEALRSWTGLRKDGLSGLAPDEGTVLRRVLGRAPSDSLVTCVTAGPKPNSKVIQVGRNIYYESSIPVSEFLSSLRTVDAGNSESASYLPRNSVLSVPQIRLDTHLTAEELGEWCGFG